jgi:hypothetical protein
MTGLYQPDAALEGRPKNWKLFLPPEQIPWSQGLELQGTFVPASN